MAAWITIGLMILVAIFSVIVAFSGNTTEDGTFEWVKFLAEASSFIPVCAVIFLVAEGLHKVTTQSWIDFRGPTGRFLR